MTEIYRGSGRSTNHFNDRGKLIESYSPPTQNDRPQQQLNSQSDATGSRQSDARPSD